METPEEENPPTNIKLAFYDAITKMSVYKKLGLSRSTVSNLKRNIEHGEFPSHEKMKEILEKLGYEIVQVELWKKTQP